MESEESKEFECKNCCNMFYLADGRNENFCCDDCLYEYQEENYDGEEE